MAVVEGIGIGGWTALDGSPLGGLQQPKSRNADSDLQRGLEVRIREVVRAESNCRHRDFQVREMARTG
jgi:hypothetical protein